MNWLRNPETNRIRPSVKAAAAAALLATAACGPTEKPTANRGAGDTGLSPAPASTVAPNQQPTGVVPWSEADAASMPFPGRVDVPADFCHTYSANHPQPEVLRTIGGKTLVLAVVTNCTNKEAGSIPAYSDASFTSQQESQSDGTTPATVPNGTVVAVRHTADGQTVCTDGQRSSTWYSASVEAAGPAVWLPQADIPGLPTAANTHIRTLEPSVFAGQEAGNCS
ncbi:MAG TPA: hypothetical protein VMY99_03765 [Nevskiaceae bacterium]|nr:hypothetical protein [Nevskiaceae bacterium]